MGLTKTDNYTEDQNSISIMFKALGHPARIAIIEHLIKTESCICGDFVNVLPLAQPTVSQHLKELKSVGLIKGNISGNAICYCIDEENWNRIKSMTMGLFNAYTERNTCC